MRIDAHQHFWQYSSVEYDWIDENMSQLRRDFLPQDLLPLLRENDVAGCVAVQARQSMQETHWLLSLAQQYQQILGVVGWIDLTSNTLRSELQALRGNPWLKGFRHVLQGESELNFMLQPAFIQGIECLAEQGYSYDILVHSGQLPQVCELVKKLPQMKLVIDHVAKPDIAAQQWQGWAEYMLELGQHQHLYCKLSGLVTEANWQSWSAADIEPYLAHMLKAFGAERLMYGSDWPVCQVAANYSETLGLVEQFVSRECPEKRAAVMGGNAAGFYALGR
jgi:L-fuconolactonase